MTIPLLTDTTPAAADLQSRVLRGLAGPRRLALAVEMSLTAKALLVARLRTEHPEWSAAQIARESLRLTLPGAVLPPILR